MKLLQLPAELRAGILEECFVKGTDLTSKEVYVNEHFRCRQISRDTRRGLNTMATIRLVCQQFREDADEVFFRHYKVTRSIGALAPLERSWSSHMAGFVLSKLRYLSLQMLVGNSTMIVLRLELRKQADAWSCEWKHDVYHDLEKDDIVSEQRMIRSGLPFVASQLSLIGRGEGLCYDDIEALRVIMAKQCTVDLPDGPDTQSWYFDDYSARIGAAEMEADVRITNPEPSVESEHQEAPPSSNEVESFTVSNLVASPWRESSPRHVISPPTTESQQRTSFHMLELQGRTYLAPAQGCKSFDLDLATLDDHELIAKYNLERVRTSVVQKARRTIGGRCKSSARRIRGVVSRMSRAVSYSQAW